jgi:hypothetical protein
VSEWGERERERGEGRALVFPCVVKGLDCGPSLTDETTLVVAERYRTEWNNPFHFPGTPLWYLLK